MRAFTGRAAACLAAFAAAVSDITATVWAFSAGVSRTIAALASFAATTAAVEAKHVSDFVAVSAVRRCDAAGDGKNHQRDDGRRAKDGASWLGVFSHVACAIRN